ncbi:hypothetical protein CBR_g34773 [Chara braunii]|uniref:Uncharacterized protein n=1 Tax=Chara braunii TaxID=69332 RepID=A0A388LJF1_CHABU|nr:hypothetical protein CBR_g34773 [Chara braunii]|eukprot:GBG82397.1 hypothetical protein CBR_g34773 [Chara braunii]
MALVAVDQRRTLKRPGNNLLRTVLNSCLETMGSANRFDLIEDMSGPGVYVTDISERDVPSYGSTSPASSMAPYRECCSNSPTGGRHDARTVGSSCPKGQQRSGDGRGNGAGDDGGDDSDAGFGPGWGLVEEQKEEMLDSGYFREQQGGSGGRGRGTGRNGVGGDGGLEGWNSAAIPGTPDLLNVTPADTPSPSNRERGPGRNSGEERLETMVDSNRVIGQQRGGGGRGRGAGRNGVAGDCGLGSRSSGPIEGTADLPNAAPANILSPSNRGRGRGRNSGEERLETMEDSSRVIGQQRGGGGRGRGAGRNGVGADGGLGSRSSAPIEGTADLPNAAPADMRSPSNRGRGPGQNSGEERLETMVDSNHRRGQQRDGGGGGGGHGSGAGGDDGDGGFSPGRNSEDKRNDRMMDPDHPRGQQRGGGSSGRTAGRNGGSGGGDVGSWDSAAATEGTSALPNADAGKTFFASDRNRCPRLNPGQASREPLTDSGHRRGHQRGGGGRGTSAHARGGDGGDGRFVPGWSSEEQRKERFMDSNCPVDRGRGRGRNRGAGRNIGGSQGGLGSSDAAASQGTPDPPDAAAADTFCLSDGGRGPHRKAGNQRRERTRDSDDSGGEQRGGSGRGSGAGGYGCGGDGEIASGLTLEDERSERMVDSGRPRGQQRSSKGHGSGAGGGGGDEFGRGWNAEEERMVPSDLPSGQQCSDGGQDSGAGSGGGDEFGRGWNSEEESMVDSDHPRGQQRRGGGHGGGAGGGAGGYAGSSDGGFGPGCSTEEARKEGKMDSDRRRRQQRSVGGRRRGAGRNGGGGGGSSGSWDSAACACPSDPATPDPLDRCPRRNAGEGRKETMSDMDSSSGEQYGRPCRGKAGAEVIKLRALGRTAHLWDLYDLSTDTFCQNPYGENIKALSTDRVGQVSKACPSLNVSHVLDDSPSIRFQTLGVSSQLKLSILGGLFCPQGTGSYLVDRTTGGGGEPGAVKATLFCQVIAGEHHLELSSGSSQQLSKEIEAVLSSNQPETAWATHFVSRIVFGATLVVSVTSFNAFQGFPSENQGQAVPVIIYLSRLSDVLLSESAVRLLKWDGSSLLLHPDEDTIAGTERLLQEVHHIQGEVDSLLYDTDSAIRSRGNHLIIMSDIYRLQELKERLSTSLEELIERVGRMTVCIRRSQGREDSSGMRSMLENFRCKWLSDSPRDQVATARASFEKRMSFFNELQCNGITFTATLDYDAQMAECNILSGHTDDSVYILVHHQDAPHAELWRKHMDMLKRVVDESKSGHVVSNRECHGDHGERGLRGFKSRPPGMARGSEGRKMASAPFFYYLELQREDSHDGRRQVPDKAARLPRTVIRFYQRCRLVHEDCAQHMDTIGTLCLVRCEEIQKLPNEETSGSRDGPQKRTTPLQIKCPGAVYGECASTIQYWYCDRCYVQVEYDWHGYVSCYCGRAPLRSLCYLCRHPKHRHEYMCYSPMDDLTTDLNKLEMRKEINILLLGETGVGKSTFINAFANYLNFDDMQVAKEDLLALIPSQFTVCQDNDYAGVLVSIGKKDANEEESPGKSCTQSCKAYVFNYGEYVVRLIDTPGVGDTGGIGQDKKNFDNILRFLSHHKLIHSICILLKPNNARLNVLFRFCIMELLCHIHKSAKDNIVFLFTNARSTFYRPGDTMPPLMEMLKKVRHSPPNVDIQLGKRTIYSLDNESFRFLAAVKKGVRFSDKQTADFAKSWKWSVSECRRLIDHILSLPPHKVQDTVSINEARRLILGLARPLGDISKVIQINKNLIEDKMSEDVSDINHIEDLKKKLFVPSVDLEYRELTQPHTVCAADSCREIITVGGLSKIDYQTRCHEPCFLVNVGVETLNNPSIRSCYAIQSDGKCRSCGCGWEVHMHDRIKTVEDARAKHRRVIQEMEDKLKRLDEEQQTISRTLARFAVFLKANAITPYNDSTLEYLGHLIDEETTLRDAGKGNSEILNGLVKLRQDYEEEVRILTTAMNDPSGASAPSTFITPEQIKSSVQDLFALEVNGSNIEKAVEELEKARVAHFAYMETVVRMRGLGPKKPYRGAHEQLVQTRYSLHTVGQQGGSTSRQGRAMEGQAGAGGTRGGLSHMDGLGGGNYRYHENPVGYDGQGDDSGMYRWPTGGSSQGGHHRCDYEGEFVAYGKSAAYRDEWHGQGSREWSDIYGDSGGGFNQDVDRRNAEYRNCA